MAQTLSEKGASLHCSTIIERAILSSPDTASPAFLDLLSSAASTCSSAAGLSQPFLAFRCVEDPNHVLLLGEWPCLQAHADFIQTEENQRLLKRAGKLDVKVQDFCHFSAPREAGGSAELAAWVQDAPVLAVAQHWTKDADSYAAAYARVRHCLAAATGNREGGGWRIEAPGRSDTGFNDEELPEEGLKLNDQWIQLSGWETVEEHRTFAGSELFKAEYGPQILGTVAAFKVRHWTRLL